MHGRNLSHATRLPLRVGREGLDGSHAPAGIALMAGEASGLLDAWASSPESLYLNRSLNAISSANGARGITCRALGAVAASYRLHAA